jgi:hypothetical protein
MEGGGCRTGGAAAELVGARVIDVTPAAQDFDHIDYNCHRQAETNAWLKVNRSPWEKFVVLDDCA